MLKNSTFSWSEWVLFVSIFLLLSMSIFILRSTASFVFPTYFIYVFTALILFYLFLKVDFEVLLVFSPHLFVISVLSLVLPLIFGQVTRGAIRWIPLGDLTIQPSEITRPFLLLFFAKYITQEELSFKRLLKAFFLFSIPFSLIFIQPSLGVAALTSVGFFGVILASSIEKKYILAAILVFLLLIPSAWLVLKPYQKQRLISFLDPYIDPQGAGYNSIQSMISVGSGKIFGRGLGEGVQTQLAFLPEKHTDFIFAAISEELGFFGAIFVLLALFAIFWNLIYIVGNSKGPTARAYVVGVLLVLFVQTLIHIGMNMGLFPITGIPLPFVSAGGSALLGSSIAIAMAIKAKKTL